MKGVWKVQSACIIYPESL